MPDLKREAYVVAGHWVTSDTRIKVDIPATGESVGRVPALGREAARAAIGAAQAAMPAWGERALDTAWMTISRSNIRA